MNHIKGKAIVLTNGMLAENFAKTAHGLLRGSSRFEVLAIIDYKFSGQDAGEIMEGRNLGIPVIASVKDFFRQFPDHQPSYCVVGVALPGGYLPDDFRQELREAILSGLSIVCGLHTFLSEDIEFSTLAKEKKVQLIDVRKPKPRSELQFWNGSIFKVKTPRIAVLGTDCAVGKRTTCRFLMEMCQGHGINAKMIYTGQTGWMQGYEHGFIFDSTVNDFVSGEMERAIVNCDLQENPDLILIEGQSALRNPTGPCGSEILLSGNVKGVILQHHPGRPFFEGTEHVEQHIPSLKSEIELIAMYGAEVLAITLSEEHLKEAEIVGIQNKILQKLNLPVLRPLKEGVGGLLKTIQNFMNKQKN